MKQLLFIVCIISVIFVSIVIIQSIHNPAPQKAVFDKEHYVAIVNDEGIKRDDYNQRLNMEQQFFKHNNQESLQLQTLPQDVLNGMIDEVLINQLAKQKKITVSQSEVEKRYQLTFAGSKKSEKEFIANLNNLYGLNKQTYMNTLKIDILKDKLQATLNQPLQDWVNGKKTISSIQIF